MRINKRRKQRLQEVILLATVAIICLVLFASLRNIDKQIWNEGICKECEGQMEYNRTIPHSSYVEFEYKCSGCGDTVRCETDFR